MLIQSDTGLQRHTSLQWQVRCGRCHRPRPTTPHPNPTLIPLSLGLSRTIKEPTTFPGNCKSSSAFCLATPSNSHLDVETSIVRGNRFLTLVLMFSLPYVRFYIEALVTLIHTLNVCVYVCVAIKRWNWRWNIIWGYKYNMWFIPQDIESMLRTHYREDTQSSPVVNLCNMDVRNVVVMACFQRANFPPRPLS